MKKRTSPDHRHAEPLPKSTFLIFFGDTAFNRILNFLIENEEFEYSLTEIARHADVSRSMANLIWPRLLDHGFVVETRRIGRARMHRLNAKSPLVQHLLKLDWELSKKEAMREAQEQKMTIGIQKARKN